MNRLLKVTAIIEATTGVALMIDPPIVTQLLLGTEVSGVAIAIGRVGGLGLLSLGLACWPGNEPARSAFRAMLTYNLLATLYLLYLGIRGEWVGLLLWPAVVVHGALAFLLVRAWLSETKVQ